MLVTALLLTLAKPVFLASYFQGNGEDGVYLAVSDDGYKFRPLLEPNVPILKSEIGKDKLMRDPCILRGPDGTWHMVWTTGWWDQGIGISHSKDLVHWDPPQEIPVMKDVPGTLNAWAPEIAYDKKEKEYAIVWSSTVKGRFDETLPKKGADTGPNNTPLNHRYYVTTTSDFNSYAPSRLLWDPGFNSIDATLFHDGVRWVLFGKDETKAPKPAKFLFAAAGPHPTGPFAIVSDRITGQYWAEGPTAVKDKGMYRVYFDRYMDKKWGAVESKDLLEWTDVSDKVQMVEGARHGTITVVDEGFVKKLREGLSGTL